MSNVYLFQTNLDMVRCQSFYLQPSLMRASACTLQQRWTSEQHWQKLSEDRIDVLIDYMESHRRLSMIWYLWAPDSSVANEEMPGSAALSHVIPVNSALAATIYQQILEHKT